MGSGVPEKEAAGRIVKANKGAFSRDGDLRAGWWRLRIPEQTIDLFQAYTHVVLDALGLQVHWVDSWFRLPALGRDPLRHQCTARAAEVAALVARLTNWT
jgi:hypothetical protein